MLFSSLNLFADAKTRSQRITTAVMAVFMVQIFAAGFCVTTTSAAHAAPAMTAVANHCAEMSMDMAAPQNSEQGKHASHCDLPDASFILEKLSTSDVDLSIQLYVLAVVPMAFDVEVSSFSTIPLDLVPLRTDLSSFNLNLRTRV